MLIGIVSEAHRGETRVAATPATVVQLVKLDTTSSWTGAGALSSFPDDAYIEAGARLVTRSRQTSVRGGRSHAGAVGRVEAGATVMGIMSPA
ncbi:hypothetical protein [Streptomyces sp. F001]|uniref:hypothetical protein n=1 Tax=Streptomyces sp. F001 TaxID=1510026 RepID=UPI001F0E59A2|nr:hypothetical protein [Streptomyces sp. F001]